MTISSDFVPSSDGATTTLPGSINVDLDLPELTTPQERYDHGYKRGYLAGYAEGARQAQAEKAADLASQKTAGAANLARVSSLLGHLSTATDRYIEQYGPHEVGLTTEVVAAAFELAEAIVGSELRARPDHAVDVARRVLMGLPTGPAIVRAHPEDVAYFQGAAEPLGNGAQNVVVMADPTVGRGGCIVTSGAITVDARVPEALARARQAFCDGSDAGGCS